MGQRGRWRNMQQRVLIDFVLTLVVAEFLGQRQLPITPHTTRSSTRLISDNSLTPTLASPYVIQSQINRALPR